MYKIDSIVKQHPRKVFIYKRPLREEKFLEKKSKMEVCWVMFKVKLKYSKISKRTLPTLHPFSGKLMFPEVTLIQLWKNMPRRKDFWLDLAGLHYQSVSWRKEQSLNNCCSPIGVAVQATVSLCALHSQKVVQQPCLVSSECQIWGRQETKS